jgi:hypothetical protein
MSQRALIRAFTALDITQQPVRRHTIRIERNCAFE